MTPDNSVRYAVERLALRLLFIVAAAFFLAYAVGPLWSTLSPFIIALPIAAALQPLITLFQKRLRFRRGIAVAFWVLLACCVAFLLLYWVLSFAVTQVITAANNAQGIVNSTVSVLQQASDRLLNAVQSTSDGLENAIREMLNEAFQWLQNEGTRLAGSLVGGTVNIASQIPYAFVYANFLVMAVFFISSRYPALRTRFNKRSEGGTGEDAQSNMNVLRLSAGKGVIGYLRVQLIFFCFLFALTWIYYQSLGFSYAVLVALIAAFLELIPQFGCGVLFIPWSIVCFLVGNSTHAWLVLGFYLGYTMIRRLTEPMLLGSNLGVSPLLSLVGMFVGMRLGGVLGLVIGPIVMVVLTGAVKAHLFDGMLRDIRLLRQYMTARWRRGSQEYQNAEK